MIKHIVMWRLREDNKRENALLLKQQLEALRATVPSIQHIEVGICFLENDAAAADVVLYSEFASRDDLHEYQAHPEHQKIVAFLNDIRTEKRVVDYEV